MATLHQLPAIDFNLVTILMTTNDEIREYKVITRCKVID